MTRNIYNLDVYIRWTLGLLIVVIAFSTTYYWLLVLTFLLMYTATTKHCYVYDFLDINRSFQERNYFMSLLPKYNPNPMLIFSGHDNLLFQNEAAKITVPFLRSLKKQLPIPDEALHALISNDTIENHEIEQDGKYYNVKLKGVKEIDSIIAYVQDITDVVRSNEEIIEAQKEIVYTLGEVGETRSKETGNHVKRVAEYSKILALRYGLSEQEAELLKTASPMHDIGKIGIPDAILNKPAKLDDHEWEIMKTHATLGYEILKHSEKEILKAAAIIAHQHHEKYDGTGYPRGLKGDEIHIYGRITAVADVFDALGSDRVYKKSWGLEAILELFKREANRHFDPVLIQILFDNLEDFMKIRNTFKDEPAMEQGDALSAL